MFSVALRRATILLVCATLLASIVTGTWYVTRRLHEDPETERANAAEAKVADCEPRFASLPDTQRSYTADLDGDGEEEHLLLLEGASAESVTAPCPRFRLMAMKREADGLTLIGHVALDITGIEEEIGRVRVGKRSVIVLSAADGNAPATYYVFEQDGTAYVYLWDLYPQQFVDIDRDGKDEIIATSVVGLTEPLPNNAVVARWSDDLGSFDPIPSPALKDILFLSGRDPGRGIGVDGQGKVFSIRYDTAQNRIVTTGWYVLGQDLYEGLNQAIDFAEVAYDGSRHVVKIGPRFVSLKADGHIQLEPSSEDLLRRFESLPPIHPRGLWRTTVRASTTVGDQHL